MQTLPTCQRGLRRQHCSAPLRKPISIFGGALLFAFICNSYAKSPDDKTSQMYRYTDTNGALVTTNAITPEYARKGYQIVTVTGVVLATVPPEPTAEDRQKLAQAEKNKLSAAQQREHDKDLLLRYNSLGDIAVAKKRRLDEINNQIVLLNANANTLKSQMDNEHKRAAIYERNGQPVPQIQLDKVSDLQQAIKVTEDQITLRKAELVSETDRFNKDTQRLIYLNKIRNR